MSWNPGDQFKVTNLPKGWTSVFKVGQVYTVLKTEISKNKEEPGINIMTKEHGADCYVQEHHVSPISKLHEVLK